MMRQAVHFQVVQALPNGVSVAVEMVRFEPTEIFPGPFSDRGTTGEKVSPVVRDALKGQGTGEPAPRSPLRPGGDRGSPRPIRAASLGDKPHGEHNLQDELREIRRHLAEVSSELAKLQKKLEPADNADRALKERLRDSHRDRHDFSRLARDMRRPVYLEQLKLSEEYGPLRRERRDLVAVQKTLTKHIETLERQSLKAKG